MAPSRVKQPVFFVVIAAIANCGHGHDASAPDAGLTICAKDGGNHTFNPQDEVVDSTGIATTIPAAMLFNPTAQAGTLVNGTNGRFCETCHHIADAWTITPERASATFNTGAFDKGVKQYSTNSEATSNEQLAPMFRTIDGTVAPNADVSTPQTRLRAYALLLGRGLIRVSLPMPTGAEFLLQSVDDPYIAATASQLSLYRRPAMMADLKFLTTVMWDGRESLAGETLTNELQKQAGDAIAAHEEPTAPPDQVTLDEIFQFETNNLFAQIQDANAGWLDDCGAHGGVTVLANIPFYAGINAFPGPDPKNVPYSPTVFTLYEAWQSLSGNDSRSLARTAIARGENLFNSRTFVITAVGGLNDELNQPMIQGTCSTCHNTPNIGNNSQGFLFDIGVSDAARRTQDVPLYTFVNRSTEAMVQTMDPGRALITGRWADMNRFKVPTLRGLAARAPYFHDGSAADLSDVVNYVDTRFSIGLTTQEKSDLTAFLAAL